MKNIVYVKNEIIESQKKKFNENKGNLDSDIKELKL